MGESPLSVNSGSVLFICFVRNRKYECHSAAWRERPVDRVFILSGPADHPHIYPLGSEL